MKKTRFLALVLVVAIALMGAGYAFWHEDLTIAAQVDTGDLSFIFDDVSFEGGDYVVGQYDYVNGSVTPNGNNLDIVLGNMHPGAKAKVGFCIVNTGTIGMKLEDFEFVGNDPNLAKLGIWNGSQAVSIEEYFSSLEPIFVDVDDQHCMDLTFAVYKCAVEEEFNENAEFDFSISAIVKQYNDDGSCEENPSPDPEISGIVVKDKKISDCTCKSKNCKDKKVTANVYYVYDDGNESPAGKINETIKKGQTINVKFGEFTVTISWPKHGSVTITP